MKTESVKRYPNIHDMSWFFSNIRFSTKFLDSFQIIRIMEFLKTGIGSSETQIFEANPFSAAQRLRVWDKKIVFRG